MGKFVLEKDEITPRLNVLPVKLAAAIGAVFEYSANNIQNHMRTNAPWTDRTSNARGGLYAKSFVKPTRFVIVLYHSVPYGIWLEVRWNGKYAIIAPTLQVKGREVMALVRGVMARMG